MEIWLPHIDRKRKMATQLLDKILKKGKQKRNRSRRRCSRRGKTNH